MNAETTASDFAMVSGLMSPEAYAVWYAAKRAEYERLYQGSHDERERVFMATMKG